MSSCYHRTGNKSILSIAVYMNVYLITPLALNTDLKNICTFHIVAHCLFFFDLYFLVTSEALPVLFFLHVSWWYFLFVDLCALPTFLSRAFIFWKIKSLTSLEYYAFTNTFLLIQFSVRLFQPTVQTLFFLLQFHKL